MIFNIQKCSIHDGEGLRTLVFFKGCPLKCPWCANPESQSYLPDIMESPVKCIGCDVCKTVCPTHAIGDDNKIDRSLCNNCFKCMDVCYAESKKIVGKEYTTEELYKEILKDKPFYSLYGGGVTFSGGEPLTHPADLTEIAKKCHKNGIGVMIESCGYGKYEEFSTALPYIEGMFLDIKIMDPEKHKEVTGVDNVGILENIKAISEFGIPITIRTPIIPGYTDTKENIQAIAQFVETLPTVKEYELLAYHNFGESKYASLGREYDLKGVQPPKDDEMRELVKYANQALSNSKKICYWTTDNNKEVVK